MSFFIANQNECRDEELVMEEHGNLLSIQVALTEQYKHRVKYLEKAGKLKVLLRLFVDFLKKSGKNSSIIEAIECKSIDFPDFYPQTKPFIAFLKYTNEKLKQYYGHYQLYKQMFYLILMKEQYLNQIEQIYQLLTKIGANACALRIQNYRLVDLEMKKISIYDSLVRNMELRMIAVGKGNNIAYYNDSDLSERLEEAEDRLQLMKSIVKNGGWGLISRIRERIDALKY